MPDSDYLDVVSFRQRGEKPYAHRIGSAKANGKGGFNVWLDSLPLPDKDGKVSLLISPRRESGGQQRQQTRPTQGRADDLEDNIPF